MCCVLFWVTVALMLLLFIFGYLLLLVIGMFCVRKVGIFAIVVVLFLVCWIFDVVGNWSDLVCRVLLFNFFIVYLFVICLCMLLVVLGVCVSGYVLFFVCYFIDMFQNLWELIG